MSWPISATAVIAMTALALGCSQPPTRQGASVPAKPAQFAAAPAVSDYDPNRWQDVEIPPETAAPAHTVQPAVGVSGVRYEAPRLVRQSAGLLSITQIGLSTTDAAEVVGRRLVRSTQVYDAAVPAPLIDPAESLMPILGPAVSGFGGVEYVLSIRLAWTTGSPLALAELGLDE